MMKSLSRNDRGSALLISLALILMLTGVAMMASDRATTDIELSYNEVHNQQAFYVAESGLMKAVVKLDDSPLWREGYTNEQLGDGFYTVIIYDSSVIAGLDDTVIAQSTGNQSGSAATVEGIIVPEYFYPFKYATYGDDSVILKNTACTDSYNADSGTYAATQDTVGGDIGSNGFITMSNTADVYGDASTAGGDITLDNSAAVSGDTSTTQDSLNFAAISDDGYIWAESVNNAPTGFSGGYTYNPGTDALELFNGDVLTLSTGVYYFSTIDIRQGGSIHLEPGANVSIYMTGNLTLEQYSSLNPDGIPSDFIIYSKGDQLSLGNSMEFRAAFWGPNTDIVIENNTDVYGSLIGESIWIANSACIHYDRSLTKVVGTDPISMEMIAWKQY